MQYGEYTLSPDISPVTTADTAAELGCKPWRWAKACVCRLIRPARIGKSAYLRCRTMLSPWRAGSGSGGCQTPWTVFLPYRLDGFPWSNFFYDRQGSPFRRSCRRPRLADTSVIMGVHIQKSTKSNWVPYGPQSVFLCLYFCVYSIFARDCCFTIRFLANFVSLKWLSPIMVLGLSCGQRGADCPLVTFLPPYKCSALKCSSLNTVSVYRMARSL